MTDVYDKDLGYIGSDGRGQCYISFYGFSPMLSCYVNQSGGYYYNFADTASPSNSSWFAMKFYYYALSEGYSVRDSLDIASGEFFGCDYEQTVLNRGYHSWWPGGDWSGDQWYLSNPGYFPRDFNQYLVSPRDPNRMRVFGDANIKLYQPLLTLSASGGLSPTFTINDASYAPGNHRVLHGRVYTIDVNDVAGYDFSHFSYKGNSYGRPANIQISSDGELVAHYNPTPEPYIEILSSTGGYTNPSAGYYTGSGTMQITAYANQDYSHERPLALS